VAIHVDVSLYELGRRQHHTTVDAQDLSGHVGRSVTCEGCRDDVSKPPRRTDRFARRRAG
jgi:hypothetical protein